MKRNQGAFTLLETLVMLIISALVVTLMFQALAGFNRARQRVAAIEGVRDNRSVLFGWMRDSISAIVAIAPIPGAAVPADDPSLGLRGNAEGFAATTLGSLVAPSGTPVTVSWRVSVANGRARLMYQEQAGESFAFDLGRAEVSFQYMDVEGKWQSSWPPELGVASPLPLAVELTMRSGGREDIWVQALAAPEPITPAPYTADPQ